MLKGTPTEDHLARMYYELAKHGAASAGEEKAWPYGEMSQSELFCLAADMSRYDPRLFDVLVSFLDRRWGALDPLAIRSTYAFMETPQTIAVMAEFLLGRQGHPDEKRFFFEYLQKGLAPVPLQLYYHYLYRPGGELMMRAAEAPLQEYKRWGFLAREAPVLDEAGRRTVGSRDAASRRNILVRLLEERKRIRMVDYLAALDFGISRQQALLDMRSTKGVRLTGRGPGARWERAA
ncbi:MAG: hypothetical protein JXA24_06760 [Proteobacteria bacterium]|nr:hypothetical protein [Pseudomonadota bacterium]